MDPLNIGLFNLAEKRLAWTSARQTVLAANIANANTPAYQAKDVEGFQQMLSGMGALAPTRTQAAHLAGTATAGGVAIRNTLPINRSIDGNSVSLDQQLTQIADTDTTQSLVTTVWKKYVSMFNLALGRSA